MAIKTAGELRGFLADVLLAIRSGDVDVEQANAIAKVAAQINGSLAVEAKTAIELKRIGTGGQQHVVGSTQIASGDLESIRAEEWCEQCEARVTAEDASKCKAKFCKLRKAA